MNSNKRLNIFTTELLLRSHLLFHLVLISLQITHVWTDTSLRRSTTIWPCASSQAGASPTT